MSNTRARPLHLRVGDLVEVRSEEEILATLDEQGTVDGMPFMPEMLEFCGKRFRVEKRADKTCNTINPIGSRRIRDAVHLEGTRCNGAAHGGCQAFCFLFWKEAWLKRVDSLIPNSAESPESRRLNPSGALRCDRPGLQALTQRPDTSNGPDVIYQCQATDLEKASQPLAWWDIRQYVRDVISGNIGLTDLIKAAAFRIFQKTIKITAYRAQIRAYNCVQSWRGGTPYPYLWGTLDKTPRETLGLNPGDLVQVKSHEEILQTLSSRNKNSGLWFDAEMVPYCGSVHRVLSRVESIIDERTGKMITFSRDCMILEDVLCRAHYSERRLFCPRSIYPYWREIWLKRVDQTDAHQQSSKLETTNKD
jgi:hypothetical protein